MGSKTGALTISTCLVFLYKYIITAASTSAAAPSAQEEDSLLLRAVVIRTAQEVKDYIDQFEDQRKLVDDLGTAMNAAENKSFFDILAMRERRLDAALVRESNAIATFSNFCIAEKSVLQALPAAATTALAPPLGAVAIATTTTAPATSLGTSGKKVMKRKLPEPSDG
jgi:hypothetical protein